MARCSPLCRREQTDAALSSLKRGSRVFSLLEQFREACITFFRDVPPPITGPFEPMSPRYERALVAFREEAGRILGFLENATGVQMRNGLAKLPRYFVDQ